MKTLFVRVLKSGAESFFRCGMKFGTEWQEVNVDDATAARLHAEQMLEVSETPPDALDALMKEISEKAAAAPAEPVVPADPAVPATDPAVDPAADPATPSA